ncbi:MAG: hypothetical protein ACK4RV_10120 [Caulobacter sp.]
MTRDYRTLDAIVVVACLIIMAGVMAALTFIKIPQENLPILAGLASGTFGAALGAYVGARWGNKKPAAEGEPDPPPGLSVTATASTEKQE